MEKVVIWGCGVYTKKTIGKDIIPWESVKAFCDNDATKQGTFFFGRKIVSPKEIDDDCKTIVIGSDVFYSEIFDMASKFYPDKEIISIDKFAERFEYQESSMINWNRSRLVSQLNESGQIKRECLTDAKLLYDRVEPLKLLRNMKVIGEVGVAYGDFTQELLDYLKPEKLYAIDYFNKDNPYISFWGRNDFAESNMEHEVWYRNRFKNQIASGQMKVLSGMSWDCLEQQPDDTYDYLYIDACHDYDSVVKDIEVAYKKVKCKGIIQFNDYTFWDMFSNMYYGVVPAVNRFINMTNSKVLYLCLNKNGFYDIVVEVNK